ncbi:IgGFc-binding protein-like [Rhinatrema bivittatum]|uniref:IgGFc-binding protein-like n=1 Tax=Rhinatrema bivittatum TaxID=194408 RepID=UPI00112C31DF|nr:IgGFc-binding protein-like [Rhinatrema bivittatum]
MAGIPVCSGTNIHAPFWAPYADYQDVFSKQQADILPPLRKFNCPIELLLSSTPPKGRTYLLSLPESQAMSTYIKENLAKGFIRPSISPVGAGFLFMKKDVYLDDILIFSKDLESHRFHVQTILQRLKDQHLYAKFEKCLFEYSSLPFLGYIISSQGFTMDLDKFQGLIYAPPGILESDPSLVIELIAKHFNTDKPAILMGDFNLHVDATPLSANCETLLTTLSHLGFRQIVNSPTHKAGHTLDLIFINEGILLPANPICSPVPWSDYQIISTVLEIKEHPPQAAPTTSVTFRKPCSRELLSMQLSKELAQLDLSDANTATSSWTTITSKVADQTCPAITKTLHPERDNRKPWFTPELKALKQDLRSKEHSWHKNPSTITLAAFKSCLNAYRNVINRTKKEFFSKKIHHFIFDSRALFSFISALTKPSTPPIPDDQATGKANELADYFEKKISSLIVPLKATSPSSSSTFSTGQQRNTSLVSFKPTSSLEIENILKKFKPSSHPSDHIPSNLLLTIQNTVTKPLADIINCSLVQDACVAVPQGKEFITTFMEDCQTNCPPDRFQVTITGYTNSTSVTISLNQFNFTKTFTVNEQQTVSVQIPSSIEISGNTKSSKTVIIQADNDISVLSSNADTSVLLPVQELDTEYYLVTPNEGLSEVLNEFSITAYQGTTIDIDLNGSLTYQNQNYDTGSKLTIALQSFESIQLQSIDDLTGTRIVAQNPVAVMTGHSCTTMSTNCSHVYEQLQPVSKWGTTYIVPPVSDQAKPVSKRDTTYLVPPLSDQAKPDIAYVVASQPTQVNYETGSTKESKNLGAGEFLQLEVTDALSISADVGVQVVLWHTGWDSVKGYVHGPFLTTIPDNASYCTDYYIHGQQGFTNYAVIIAKTSATAELEFDGKPLSSVNWQQIADTEYSWGEFNFGSDFSFHLIDHPNSPFELLSVGSADTEGYGSSAVCIGSKSLASCNTMQCRNKETCNVLNGQPVCVPDSQAVCWAFGDPHYHSFDGWNYAFQGTCTYTIAKYCGNDTTLPDFNIDAKNENRGSTKVSYIGLMTLQIYGYSITAVAFEYGQVRVDNQLLSLPITLNDGELQLYQTGSSLLIQTDNLKVYYDWNQFLKVQISSSYFGSVCGMCGNYNGDPNDDFMTPEEVAAPSATDFGKSWKVEDGDMFCWDDCNGECQTCSQDLQNKYESELFCGLITKQVDGPFRECYSVIDPQVYMDSCVYDMCLNDGYQQILCQYLTAYGEICQRNNVAIYEWRNISGCPMQCPENSQYNICGSACPATCNDDAAKCTEPCVETCECNDGFVLNQGNCVPKSSCGCIYQGRIYDANEKFWADNTCTTQCICNPTTRQVECMATKCNANQKCDVVKGIQDCYPVTYGTCSASGDPHFITFDNRRYNFQGTCLYLFAGLINKNKGLPDFQVYIHNDNRGKQTVSYVAFVEFIYLAYDIILSRDNPDKVMVNGQLYNLPYSIENKKINIYKQGTIAIIQTKSSLRATFNYDARVSVTIPLSFSGAVGGLCGDFNGDPGNDLIMKNGMTTTNETLFGQSWKVKDTPGCTEENKGDCSDLITVGNLQKESNTNCGVLLDNNGPFGACHAQVIPDGYFQDCVYDYCFYKGRQDIICKVISSYAAACQDAGATISAWRSATFCSLSCPVNSHYELCASGCASTCASLLVPAPCDNVCLEGCTCDEGFVFSGGQCVPMAQCGCSYNGAYYTSGEQFIPDGLCSQQCTCEAGGVECMAFSCGPNEECAVIDGIQKCQPIGSAMCLAAGGQHYLTYDGLAYDFQGTCTYTLTKTITESSNLVPFVINVENEMMVSVEVYNYTLILLQNNNGLMVNGVFYNLPLSIEDGKIRAYQDGINVIVATDVGLQVSFDLVYLVVVTVPGNYKNQLGGLCGNYNGDNTDEFQLPDQTLAADATTFGSAWEVQVPGVTCDHGCGAAGNACPVCEDKKKEIFSNDNYCGILQTFNGPFSACYSTINSDFYYNNCINDLCMGNGDSTILCDSIHSYVTACQSVGVIIQSWRNESFCPLACPANSQYKLCADTCSTTCAGLNDPAQCPTSCAEGCECNDGFLFDGQQCIPIENCGCFASGKYYRVNESVIDNDCMEICSCNPDGGVVCDAYSCASDESCQILDGIMGCINKDPCKSATCRTKETCQIQDGKPVCVADYFGTCWAWGDSHYHTFDGYNYDFQGTCTYTLAMYSGSDPTLVPFVIDNKNDNQAVSSSVGLISVYIYNSNISIYQGEIGQIRLNGVITNLPVTLEDGKIQLFQSGLNAILQAECGLIVTYDWHSQAVISIPSSYYGAVAGICGNFNQNPGDEMITPDGTNVASIVEWASSWEVVDQDPLCFNTCNGTCPTCDESMMTLYEGDGYCGLISKADGAFLECQSVISPDDFFKSCVNDVCVNGGAKQFLCQALSAYASACRNQGVQIDDWRTPAGCPLPCGENSHYEACGNACPATCSDQAAPSQCTASCVETCQCNTGFVLSVDKCVSNDSCGCNYNGLYYKPNEEFWSDNNCQVKCKCDPALGMVVCKNKNCKASESCQVVNGIRDCYPLSYSTCIAHGDPHYVTFDGYTYDFMGTCMYQLVGVTSQDPTLTQFAIFVQNDNRGNKAVSFTQLIVFQIYGMTFIASKAYPNMIQVNGVLTALPYYFQTNKVKVSLNGKHVVFLTNNRIRVSYDYYSYVTAKIPSTYANAVSGLCGNNNNNGNDDFIMKDGTMASTAVQFGDSWKVGDVPGCSAGSVPVVTEAQKNTYKTENFCGLITKQNGPFSKCFASIDPNPYLQDCLFDTVVYKGLSSAFCNAISTYVAVCQANGIEIQEWRTASFCSPTCPSNTHYELCGNGCPATCYGLSSPENCNAPCSEGCFCDSGLILSGDKCVPNTDCGCVYNDTYYTKGDIFYPNGQCVEQCQCNENGTVACTDASCGANEECKLVNGVQGCQPVGFGNCAASGAFHYISFDGLPFDVQSTCSYTLTEFNSSDSSLADFSVMVKNKVCSSKYATVTKTVTVVANNYVVTIGPKKVKINGETVNLPVTVPDGNVWINQEGKNIIIETDFALKVLYDAAYYVAVAVPSSYKGNVAGLCGNFNDDTKDDFMLPNSQIAQNVNEFGAAWQVNAQDVSCTNGCGGNCPVCDSSKLNSYKDNSTCGMITNPAGPFKNCHAKVNPANYFNQCIYDVCAVQGKGDALCKSLQAYVAACQAAGANIKRWRTSLFCPLVCPKNSQYKRCTRSCDYTCASIAAPSTCTEKCFEGCECNSGYMLSGQSCVPIGNCGCVYGGRYLNVGESIVSSDCSQRFTCSSAGTMPIVCQTGETCMVKEGVRGCFKKDGQCTLAMGAQFTSFDGLSGQVASSGLYDVASLCDVTSPSWFRVIVQSCNGFQSAADKVYIFFQNGFITVSKNEDVWVNGRKVQLPAQVSTSVSVKAVQSGVVIQQPNSMQVLLSTTGQVTVTVSSTLANATCGACGNFNGNSSDDLNLSNGNSGSDISQVIGSWMTPDLSSCGV